MNPSAKNHSQGWKGQWNRERRNHLFQQHLIINVSFIINCISSPELLSLHLLCFIFPLKLFFLMASHLSLPLLLPSQIAMN